MGVGVDAIADRFLDAAGYRCPMPVLLMEKALRAMAPGALLEVIADDPVAAVDIPHFCREAGHGVERRPAEPPFCVFLVTAWRNKGP